MSKLSLIDNFYHLMQEAKEKGLDSIEFPDDFKYGHRVHNIRNLLNHKFKKEYSLQEVYSICYEEGLYEAKFYGIPSWYIEKYSII